MLILVAVVVVALALTVLGTSVVERPSLVIVVVGGGLLFVVLVGIAAFGLRGGGSDDHEAPSPPDRAAETTQPARPRDDAKPRDDKVADRLIDVVIGSGEGDQGFSRAGALLESLPDEGTRLVAVATPHAVVLRQCVVGTSPASERCAPGTPAGRFRGIAVGLVELRRVIDLRTRDVDCTTERCALVAARVGTPKEIASIPLVFGRPARVPTVDVEPRRDVRSGDRVDVRVAGLAAREAVTITWCVPPGPRDADACGPPAPATVVRADEDGVAEGLLTVPRGNVGANHAPCGDRFRCAVAVLGPVVSPTPVEVDFAGRPGPDIETGQLAAGLAVALLLAIVAAFLMRRRADEHPFDPFWGVSIEVPEWEGIDVTVDPDDEAVSV